MTIIFVHIPKAGGTYINNAFTAALGASVVRTHFENTPTMSFAQEMADGIKFFSGHIQLQDLVTQISAEQIEARLISCVRDPIEQTASHLRWLDYHGEPQNQKNLQYFPIQIRNEIDKIMSLDFNRACSLQQYFEGLSEMGMRLFDNMQSRVLLKSINDPADDQPSVADLDHAISQIDFFLDAATLDEDLQTLGDALRIQFTPMPKANVSPASRRIDTRDPQVRSVLEAVTEVDRALVERVRLQRSKIMAALP